MRHARLGGRPREVGSKSGQTGMSDGGPGDLGMGGHKDFGRVAKGCRDTRDDGVSAVWMATEAEFHAAGTVADFEIVVGVVIDTGASGDGDDAPKTPDNGPPTVVRNGSETGTPFSEGPVPCVLLYLVDLSVCLVPISIVDELLHVVVEAV